MNKNQITITIVGSVVVIGLIIFYNNSTGVNFMTGEKRGTNESLSITSSENDGYLLNIPNLNFEITFPEEPNFNRTDGDDFTRYSWSYLKQNPDGSWDKLYVQAEDNLYAYHPNQEDFIEDSARIYGGVVSRMEKDPNSPAINYEITGVYSRTSHKTETIVGRIVDVGEWTFNITNQFEGVNRYPSFISSFK